MTFPRSAGFRAAAARQSGDIFARAVIGSICLDIADFAEDEEAIGWQKIAEREADHVAGAKLEDRAGGWSYFPGLPELPPDLDSLAAAIVLFKRAAPHHLPLCEEPIESALAEQAADGSLPTWILSTANNPTRLKTMRRGVERFWGRGIDVEVCARFLSALAAVWPTRFADAIHLGTGFIAARQSPSGLWRATWYWGDIYGTLLCLEALRATPTIERVAARAVDAVWRLQRSDGGWGRWESVPLDTALALWTVTRYGRAHHPDRISGAVRVLLDHRASDGSWPATPWIKMDVGRASGRTGNILTYQSRTITTAFVLRTLLLIQRNWRS
jgi:squalene-hopene/tetraprenyl-beta-curcumene cyclase